MKLLGTLLLCTIALAADRPVDVKGWTTTTWGMNEEAILGALPDQAVRLAKPEKYANSTVTVGIERLTINHVDYFVHFQPDAQGGLKSVLLRPIAENPYENTFQDLAASLTEKYGRPDFNDTSMAPMKRRVMRWNFPSTTIELTFTDMSIIKRNMLSLMYIRAEKKDLDKM